MTTLIFGLLTSLLLSAFFSGTESGFYFIKKERLRLLELQGHAAARKLLNILRQPGPLVSTMLIGNNIALQLGTDVTMRYFNGMEYFHPTGGAGNPWISAEIVTTLVLFLPFFIFGEVLPKATYRLYCEDLLLKTVPLIQICRWVFWPFTALVGVVVLFLEKKLGVEAEAELRFDREHLSKNLGHAYAGGVLSAEQLESLSQAIHAGDRPVERMMTSLTQSPMLEKDASIKEIRELYERQPQASYPVYAERRTNVIGVVDMRQLTISGYQGGGLGSLLQEPVTVEWGQPFHDAISLFFERDIPLVFVVKQGKVLGFITWMEALLKLLR
jgi:putative hemolysin